MTQGVLFERGPKLPEGLVFEPEFLTVAEENELISVIRTLPFGEVRMHGVVAKRRVAAAIELPQRSLYVLAGTARTDWQHSIRPIAETRYSITFRTLKQES